MRVVHKLAVLIAVCVSCFHAAYGQSEPFSFVAMGDLPYGDTRRVEARYLALIQTVNAYRPDFSIHVGDFKSGSGECSDAEFKKQLDHFDLFEQALIYTPGDNDWTDCHRVTNGSYDPLERLTILRKLFFSTQFSLGRKPVVLDRQVSPKSRSDFPENQRWVNKDVLFVTLHVVGSNNNYDFRDPDSDAVKEFVARDAANIEWIRSAFEFAACNKMHALVFAFQADVFESKRFNESFPERSGFRTSIGDVLLPLADASPIPVLLIHGDSHVYRFDQPFFMKQKKIINLTRLEVPGALDMRAVLVTVDTQSSIPFKTKLIGIQTIEN